MPKKKLTLSVDVTVIERAKQFSRRNQTSVSQLVTEFLGSLEEEGARARRRWSVVSGACFRPR